VAFAVSGSNIFAGTMAASISFHEQRGVVTAVTTGMTEEIVITPCGERKQYFAGTDHAAYIVLRTTAHCGIRLIPV